MNTNKLNSLSANQTQFLLEAICFFEEQRADSWFGSQPEDCNYLKAQLREIRKYHEAKKAEDDFQERMWR